MKVLSLFDGISCGQLALQRAGVQVDEYYASEIDNHAIKVTHHNYPDTIQLGNVETINLDGINNIDLLIGGSPCQGFSFAGKQLNFQDDRSKLFFRYVDILKQTKPKFFFLENVKMKKEYQDIINQYLGVKPVEVNSAIVSKQTRKRLYWTNIPSPVFQDKNLYFNMWLYRLGHGYIKDELKFFEKYPTLTAQAPATKYRIIEDIDVARKATKEELRKVVTRSATPEECEEFQTLPIGYTSVIPKTRRYHTVGNGWTVDVIAEFFKNIKNY